MKNKILLLFALVAFTWQSSFAQQNLYFPPLNPTANWDTVSPASLGWCVNNIDTLYNFLQQQDTKAFIVLKDGKIALEKYFGNFTADSAWYWASAGKTLTAFLVGKAQEEQFLSINDSTSKYLGVGWTSCTPAQEGAIKISHQLTMTTGLDDGVPNTTCTTDTCLKYLAPAGSRWAYHTAAYTLLEKVLDTATHMPINTYTQTRLKSKIGMTGAWSYIGFDNVFFSKARSMARFGLLAQNNCIWNGDTLLHDTAYINQMYNTSQNLNKSYGYLWWLNGKSSFMLPTTQFVFSGSYAPSAPQDMIAGLGKNGQILSISKSKGIVIVRMGNYVNANAITPTLCDSIWRYMNAVMCAPTNIATSAEPTPEVSIYPNPAQTVFHINLPSALPATIELINIIGNRVIKTSNLSTIDISNIPSGVYFCSIRQGTKHYIKKLIKE